MKFNLKSIFTTTALVCASTLALSNAAFAEVDKSQPIQLVSSYSNTGGTHGTEGARRHHINGSSRFLNTPLAGHGDYFLRSNHHRFSCPDFGIDFFISPFDQQRAPPKQFDMQFDAHLKNSF